MLKYEPVVECFVMPAGAIGYLPSEDLSLPSKSITVLKPFFLEVYWNLAKGYFEVHLTEFMDMIEMNEEGSFDELIDPVSRALDFSFICSTAEPSTAMTEEISNEIVETMFKHFFSTLTSPNNEMFQRIAKKYLRLENIYSC